MQRQVCAALESLGLPPEEEVRLAEGYSLDFVAEQRGERLAVEVDGRRTLWAASRATLLKRRQLRHLGWRLMSVPYWEWVELNQSDKAD